MTTTPDAAERFLALHVPGEPLLLPNPWDAGTAKLLASLGFRALATTSAGHAGSLGRRDGAVSREEALAHGREIAGATPLPVSADLENGFADDPEGVAATVRTAAEAGLAGLSVEDYTGEAEKPIYEASLAAERVAAAAEAARRAGARIILTARAENHLRGVDDLDDTIARLQSFQAAGADVVYAPALRELESIRRVVQAVDVPVNVLLVPGGPTVPQLAEAGVARISVGGAFHLVALAAVARAGRELLEEGTAGFWSEAIEGIRAKDAALSRKVRRPRAPGTRPSAPRKTVAQRRGAPVVTRPR